jgi:uroporphyrin-III C-methyltransferase
VLATHSREPGSEEIRRRADADSLVFYMGRDNAHMIAAELIQAGRDQNTPVAIVEACSTPRERLFTMTLADLVAGAAQDCLDGTQPSVLLIGDAFAARASDLLVQGLLDASADVDDGRRVA